MFYDSKLMNSSKLGVVWCYANRQKVISDDVELTKICSTIEKWVDNNGSARNRMSLRTSTLLLNGTARLFKEEVDKLYQDCIQLDEKMLYRRSSPESVTDDNNSDCSSEEEHFRNPSNRNKSRKTKSREDSENNSVRSRTRFRSSRDFQSFEINSTTSQQPQSISTTSTKVHAEVQTTKSYISNKRARDRYRRNAYDVTKPMGVVMVYNEFRPTKVICANVNENVKLL